jgi:uncharacterized protein YqgC (DUF456 family)
MVYVWLSLFIVLIVLFWLLNLVGLPGNWMIVALALLWMIFGPADYRFSWVVVVVIAILALIGEAIEFGASILGTNKLGGSKRGATLSVVGSVIGGILGAIFGIPFPIPLVGSLVGSVLLAAAGAWVGAMIGEKWVGKQFQESVKIGNAAFVGRLLGTAGKLVMGSIIAVLTIAAPFFFS